MKKTDGVILKGWLDKDRSSTQSNILMDLYNGMISEWKSFALIVMGFFDTLKELIRQWPSNILSLKFS